MKITINKNQKEQFQIKLDKIQKKVSVKINSEVERTIEKQFKSQDDIRTYSAKVIDFDLDFPEIYKIDGFEYLGGLKNNSGSNIFFGDNENLVNEVDDNLVFECHHCNKKMTNRISKFYFKKLDDNTIVHFGSKCVQDYFGIDVLNAIKVVSRFVDNCNDNDEDFAEYGGMSMPKGAYHEMMIDMLIKYMSKGNCYVSKSKAECSDSIATSSIINHFLFDKKGLSEYDKEFKDYKLIYQDVERIRQEIYTYFEERKQESNFDYNLKNAFLDFSDNLGLMAYGVFEFYKSFDDKEKAVISKKRDFKHYASDLVENENVTCVNIGSCTNDWGVSQVVSFESDNHKFVWFTKANIDKVKVGNVYNIKKATIKRKDSFRGELSNVIKVTVKNIEVL